MSKTVFKHSKVKVVSDLPMNLTAAQSKELIVEEEETFPGSVFVDFLCIHEEGEEYLCIAGEGIFTLEELEFEDYDPLELEIVSEEGNKTEYFFPQYMSTNGKYYVAPHRIFHPDEDEALTAWLYFPVDICNKRTY